MLREMKGNKCMKAWEISLQDLSTQEREYMSEQRDVTRNEDNVNNRVGWLVVGVALSQQLWSYHSESKVGNLFSL